MTGSSAQPSDLGAQALAFVREELASAADDFDGPLAQRLINAPLSSAFSLLTPDAAAAAVRVGDLRHGGVDDGTADQCLAAAISRWLSQSPAARTRVLMLEDPLARRSDSATASDARHFGERVYFMAGPGDAADTIARVLRRVAGYPGIGVLSELDAGWVAPPDLTENALDSVAGRAAAVLVRAWDDEAFVVTPVGERLTPQDLRC